MTPHKQPPRTPGQGQCEAVDGQGTSSTARRLRPRPAVVVRPSYISDETCFAIGGVPERKFRERIVPRCNEVTRLGHTVMVPIDEFERVVRELGQAADDTGEVDRHEDQDDGQPRSIDDVLGRIGRERLR